MILQLLIAIALLCVGAVWIGMGAVNMLCDPPERDLDGLMLVGLRVCLPLCFIIIGVQVMPQF